ncbi:MAG: aldehyde dehydrogenase family protein [Enterocloster sp.]
MIAGRPWIGAGASQRVCSIWFLVPGEEVGNKLIEDERIRMVAFTGSTAVGRGIAAAKASALFKKYSLEMGRQESSYPFKGF